MKTVRIYVTPKDILFGSPDSCHYCPVARALNRATGQRWVVKAGFAKTAAQQIALPTKVIQFYTRFDDNRSVRPFRATLEVKSQ